MREYDIEKLPYQPVVHDPAYINPSTDPDGAEAALIAVYGTPADGDVAVYIASANRVEWRPQSALTVGTPVTVEDGMGGFLLVFDEDGNVVYA